MMENPNEPTAHGDGGESAVTRGAAKNRLAKSARLWVGLFVFLFTVVSFDDVYHRWWTLSLVVGLTVLVLQFTRFSLLRVYALWGGVFWVLQSIVSLMVVDLNYRVLLPNMKHELNVVGGLPGIEGIQRVSTDERGFRTTVPVDYDDATPLRIIAIGGSTTEQLNLDDRHTFTHLLQAALQGRRDEKVEVINTGVSGLRALHHVATLKKALTMHPDILLIMMGVNDWNRHIHLSFPDPPDTVRSSPFPAWQQGIRLRNTLLGQALFAVALASEQKAELDQTGVRTERGEYYTSQNDSLNRKIEHSFRPQRVSQDYAQQVENLLDICRRSRLKCIFLTQPNAYHEDASAEVKRHFWMTPPNTTYTLDMTSMIHIAQLYNDYLTRKADEMGFLVCDIAKDMAPSTANFYDDVHFNTNGARRVAELILPCVMQALGGES